MSGLPECLCHGGFRKWQRASFWLQYGRLRQHLQACDALLEQINACAALPGRPKLEFPAGISREVRIKHCEIPFSVTPQSPFDAALNLSFDTPRTVYPEPESPDNRLRLADPLTCSPMLQECSSLDSQPQSSVSLPKSESQVFSLVSPPSSVQVPDIGKDTCNSPENALDDPELCNDCGTIVAPLACISGSEDTGSKRSVSARENPPQLRPINFISASCYVERPSNPKSLSPGNSTRRTSFCRIEAFVIRSKSVKPLPLQRRIGMPEVKK